MRFFTVVLIVLRNFELSLRDIFGLQLRPYKVLLELTDYCNSKCKTCFIWKNTGEVKNQIRLNELNPVLEEYGTSLLWVALSGGEITLYQDFELLIDSLVRHCPNLRIVTFTTNALKPELVLQYAEKIKKAGYDLFVTISLDGDEKTHDHVRGVSGNHALAQRTMQMLKSHQIWTHYGLTVSGLNSDYISNGLQNDIDLIRAFSFEHAGGIYKTEVAGPSASFNKNIKKIRTLYKITQLGEIVEAVYIALAERFFSNEKKLPLPCEVVATSLHIRPNGDIKPCMYLPSLGNIKNDMIGTLLRSDVAKNMRNRALNGECEKCWMNCYAPHSIMRHPLLAVKKLFTA